MAITLCECGCGQPAPLSAQKRIRSDRTFSQGEPQRFIRGHATRGKGRPPLERLYERSERVDLGYETLCFVQTRGLLRTGYGQVRDADGRVRRSHIVVWEQKHGPVPDGFELDHLCHDARTCPGGFTCPHRACHEVSHLVPATHLDNVRRGSRRIATS